MKEVNKKRRRVAMTRATRRLQPVIDCTTFSSFKRLLRIIAYVLRYS